MRHLNRNISHVLTRATRMHFAFLKVDLAVESDPSLPGRYDRFFPSCQSAAENGSMEPTEVERLKREWTGKRVAVASDATTLRRFRGVLGTVVTLNMNGRALVRFDGSADIGWYDIALRELQAVVAPPAPEEVTPPTSGEPPVTSSSRPKIQPAENDASETKAKPEKAMSILELARRQGAAK